MECSTNGIVEWNSGMEWWHNNLVLKNTKSSPKKRGAWTPPMDLPLAFSVSDHYFDNVIVCKSKLTKSNTKSSQPIHCAVSISCEDLQYFWEPLRNSSTAYIAHARSTTPMRKPAPPPCRLSILYVQKLLLEVNWERS